MIGNRTRPRSFDDHLQDAHVASVAMQNREEIGVEIPRHDIHHAVKTAAMMVHALLNNGRIGVNQWELSAAESVLSGVEPHIGAMTQRDRERFEHALKMCERLRDGNTHDDGATVFDPRQGAGGVLQGVDKEAS
jgi:hypothetical protein